MRDSVKFFVCLVAYIALVTADAVMLINGTVGLPLFITIITISTVLLFLPMFFFKGTEVVLSYDRVEVRGSFLTETIPYDQIRAAEFRDSFRIGMKMYGYRGLKKCSGDFSSEEFGTVRFSGDLSIPAFVFISFSDKVLVFNARDALYTRTLYESIRSRVGDRDMPLSKGIDYEANDRRRRNIRRWTVAVFALIAAITIIVVLVVAMSGHVNVSLTDDGINIAASMENEFIAYSDIKDIGIRDEFDIGSKVIGYSGFKIDSGEFRNGEFGNYHAAIHRDVGKYIVIERNDGKHTVFNCGSADETVSMYDEILIRKGITSYPMSVPVGSQVPCYL